MGFESQMMPKMHRIELPVFLVSWHYLEAECFPKYPDHSQISSQAQASRGQTCLSESGHEGCSSLKWLLFQAASCVALQDLEAVAGLTQLQRLCLSKRGDWGDPPEVNESYLACLTGLQSLTLQSFNFTGGLQLIAAACTYLTHWALNTLLSLQSSEQHFLRCAGPPW